MSANERDSYFEELESINDREYFDECSGDDHLEIKPSPPKGDSLMAIIWGDKLAERLNNERD